MATTLTAQNVLDWNGYTTAQSTLVVTENLIDLAISDVNSRAATSIAKMTGAAGSKSASLEDNELTAVMAKTILLVHAKLYHGKSGSLGSLSSSLSIEDPQNKHYKEMYEAAITTLLRPAFTFGADFDRV